MHRLRESDRRTELANASTASGATALYFAVRAELSNLVRLLLASGADPKGGNGNTNVSRTPLAAAIKTKRPMIIELVITAYLKTFIQAGDFLSARELEPHFQTPQERRVARRGARECSARTAPC